MNSKKKPSLYFAVITFNGIEDDSFLILADDYEDAFNKTIDYCEQNDIIVGEYNDEGDFELDYQYDIFINGIEDMHVVL